MTTETPTHRGDGVGGHLRVVDPSTPERLDDLCAEERASILRRDQRARTQVTEPTEAEQVLLEDLLVAIRRLDGSTCLSSASQIALASIDETICRRLGR
jgi:hypothetical protein